MSKLRKYLVGDLSWKRMVLSLISIYLMLLVVAVFFAHKLVFYPPSDHYDETLPHLTLIDDGQGGKIATVHYQAAKGKPTIFWSHGNAEDIGQLTDLFREFSGLGYGVIAYDYPGYGLSDGAATEKTCYATIDKVWSHATEKLGIKEQDIILLGQSVGTGPTVYLAAKNQPACVVLLAPFTSIYRVGVKYPIFPCDMFPNISRIKDVHSPLLVVHGKNDSVIPHEHGQQLVAKHQGVNQLISLEKTDHNDIYFRNLDFVVSEINHFAEAHHSVIEE
ncbi:hypothetical protein SAMN02745181_1849 [Rubritalea squalenifaciens DSM 18772]|uniref:Serine aminopeptidase S33 domain-containing protein n=1 Tax=Rubritalea squalenifaciens DSM 18772 TaxID=1123071 RepID=A0A1M6ILG3_9BACT|nr:alpha/beta hydrolase [Rubritalea squalenifaciens]SHJ35225.1 hypothetical protein SAMN02745181_1849 [Rubritalea squalenifaciens DSM 18772]